MANENENVVTVNLRKMYEDRKDKDNRVSPLLWDKKADVVVFAPEGSGRELRLSTKEFLDQFKLLPDEPTVGRTI